MSFNRNREPVRVGLVACEPIRLVGLASVFDEQRSQGSFRLVAAAGDIEELLDPSGPDCFIVDLNSSCEGFSPVETIRKRKPKARIIVIGPEGDDEFVMRSIMAGARACLDFHAGPQIVRQAVEAVIEGSIWAPRKLLSKIVDRLLNAPDTSPLEANPRLTVREQEVLSMILMARSNREIARQLGIEERTVKAHVSRLMRKTGAENRIELSMRAISLSLLPPPTASEFG